MDCAEPGFGEGSTIPAQRVGFVGFLVGTVCVGVLALRIPGQTSCLITDEALARGWRTRTVWWNRTGGGYDAEAYASRTNCG